MMFASVFLKTYGAVFLHIHPLTGVLSWAVSLIADARWAKQKSESVAATVRNIILLNVATLLTGAGLYAFYIEATMRWKDGLPLMAHAAALLMRTIGFSIAAFDGILHASTMAGVLQFPVDLNSLAVLTPLMFVGFCIVYLLVAAPDWSTVWRGLTWIAVLTLVAVLLRWVLATSFFLFLTDFVGYETEELPMLPLFKPGLSACLYLPFLIIAALLLQKRLGALPVSPGPSRSALIPPQLWICFAFFVLVAVVCWEPSGTRKQGDVVINTYHTKWSRTDRPYDREWYGSAAGYNYACMKRLYERFYPTRELTTRITSEALSTASVLIIYDPNEAFTEDERRAIHDFVENGGGIFLIGDHTNVFGGTSHLNTICRPFGFIFRDDVLFDLEEDFFQLHDVARTYSQFLHGMDFFKYRGPASIQPTSWFTRTIFRVSNAKSVRAIYSVNNFFPPPQDSPRMRTGEFSSSTASRYGRGRVLAFADSTVFSNFEIFYPGKYEFLLNGMRWLNHAEKPLTKPLKRLALLAAIVLLGYQIYRSGTPRRLLGSLLFAFVVGAVAWAICLLAEQARADFPRPVRPVDSLFFVTEQSDEPYTLREFYTKAPYDQKFDVFIQWVLRTDVFSGFYLYGPRHGNELHAMLTESEAGKQGMALIMREPKHLQILEDVGPKTLSKADPLLMMISTSTNLTRDAVMATIREAGVVQDPSHIAEIEGAWPAGEVRLEEGGRRIAVIIPAEKFSDSKMGVTEKVTPSEAHLKAYDEQFALMDWLFRREESTLPESAALSAEGD